MDDVDTRAALLLIAMVSKRIVMYLVIGSRMEIRGLFRKIGLMLSRGIAGQLRT